MKKFVEIILKSHPKKPRTKTRIVYREWVEGIPFINVSNQGNSQVNDFIGRLRKRYENYDLIDNRHMV